MKLTKCRKVFHIILICGVCYIGYARYFEILRTIFANHVNLASRSITDSKPLLQPYSETRILSLAMSGPFNSSNTPSLTQRNQTETNANIIDTVSSHLSPIDIPNVRVNAIDCSKLIDGDLKEQELADRYHQNNEKRQRSAQEIKMYASNCGEFLSSRRYIMKNSSDEEVEFPLAFSILMYKDVEQFERLLRVIYRPQNFYCIHVDKKSAKPIQDAVGAIVNCFENVFLAPEQFKVKWGAFSSLQADLSCMKGLLKYKKWKYLINLTGQEFPLKTNWEIVQILKTFNGANNLEGTIKRRNLERTDPYLPVPVNITLTKGAVHMLASRGFVEYAIENETAIKFLEWVKKTIEPDETFFTSLNHNPHLGVPGSYKGIPETDFQTYLFVARFKYWQSGPHPFVGNWTCGGQWVRSICIFGIRDLPLLSNRFELFANKFFLDYQPLVLDCMEELIFNRTRDEIPNGPKIDRAFYSGLNFVVNHV